MLEGIRGKGLREAKLFMSRVTPSGALLDKEEVCEVSLTLTKEQIALLERAREVLAAGGSVPTDGDVVTKALGDLLTKRDPMRKAERAASAQRPSRARYIPAAVRHQVWIRDQGQCVHNYPDGSRCCERMMIEVDHRALFCCAGEHSVDNLELKCRQHNSYAAEQALGFEWYRNRVQCETEVP